MRADAGEAAVSGPGKGLTIKAKITAYAATVTLILGGIGAFGYLGVSTMGRDMAATARLSTHVDAAMEMKMAVAQSMALLMELIAEADSAALERHWAAYRDAAGRFVLFADAILEGADTGEGRIEPSTNPELRAIVERARAQYDGRFGPKLEELHRVKQEQLRLVTTRAATMDAAETAFDAVLTAAHELEEAVKAHIEVRLAEGASAAAILGRENTWADAAMEMKTSLALARIAMEEYGQDMEVAARGALAAEFDGAIGEFALWLRVLRAGGETVEGRIAPLAPALHASLDALAARFDVFREAGRGFIGIQDGIAANRDRMGRLDEEADRVGGAMVETIGGVEDEAKGRMRQAVDNSRAEADTLVGRLLAAGGLGLVLSVLFGVVILRAVNRPLGEAVAAARRLAQGRLDAEVQVTSRDEMGELLTAMAHMRDSLHGVVGDVRDGAASICNAATEIAAGNGDLSQRTEEQASSLEETAASTEELTSTVRQNTEHARAAERIAAVAAEEAERGGRLVGGVATAMEAIVDTSKRVGEIIGMVDDIAFQTNLLALNAAVEAARAGEQGRGFAVVAGEVRTLSQRSADAAREIKGLLDESRRRVEDGAGLVRDSGASLQSLIRRVREVSTIATEIAAASVEQASGIEQVNQAITQMDQVTQQNAAMVEQIAAASRALQEQADRMERAVGFFKVA